MSAEDHLSTEQFGMVVHPPDEWPISHLHGVPARTARIAPDTPVHTTQTHVRADVVEAKKQEEAKPVTVAVQRIEGGQRIWLVDGHHTLAAARAQGLHVDAELHGPGTNPITPPRLRTPRNSGRR